MLTAVLLANWSQIPRREAWRLLGLGDGGVLGEVIHICCGNWFLPSNWPWARQQVVHCGLGQERVGLESHSGSSDLPLPSPLGGQAERRGVQLKPAFLSCTPPSHHFFACQGVPPKGREEPNSHCLRQPQAPSGGGGEKAGRGRGWDSCCPLQPLLWLLAQGEGIATGEQLRDSAAS